MRYWLVKSEPASYSWDQFVTDGETDWDGVRNYQARNNLRSMEAGDRVLFYHSVSEKAVVGTARVSAQAFQDPTTDDPRWLAVALVPLEPVLPPVTLEQIKGDKRLQDVALVRQNRLSVVELCRREFEAILSLSGR